MSVQEFAALLAFAAAMSFSPGPNTTLAATLAANAGLRQAMPFVCSVPVGWAAMFLVTSLGLGLAVSGEPRVRQGLVLAAAVYMVWLAWQLARRARLAALYPARIRVGFAQGLALQFVNGKAWINAMTISSTWVAVDGELLPRLAQVLPVVMAFGFASNFGYALLGASLRGWLGQGRRLLWFNRAMAAVLVATALWLLSR